MTAMYAEDPTDDDDLAPARSVGQGNEYDWHEARMGVLSASRFGEIVGKGSSFADKGMHYLVAKAIERMHGVVPVSGPMTEAMARGVELELPAMYWLLDHWTPTIQKSSWRTAKGRPYLGATPDFEAFGGTPGDIKCPSLSKCVQFMRLNHNDAGTELKQWNPLYYWQIKVQAYVCGRTHCALVYFHPDLPEHMQGTVRTYRLTDADKQTIEDVADRAHAEIDRIVHDILHSKRVL